MGSILDNIGGLYSEQGNLSLALKYRTEALALFDERGTTARRLTDLLFNLYQLNKKAGNISTSLEMYERFTIMKDSIENLENKTALAKFEYQQQAFNDSLAYIQQQAQTELDFQQKLNRRNYFLFGGLALAALLVLFVWYLQQLRRQKIEAEAQRLNELDQVKTRLYTNITHEFRTPLTVIQGMADKVLQQPDKWLKNGMNMIQRNNKQLLGLVNQLLDMAKLESGKLALSYKQADIISLLLYLAESFEALAEAKGVNLIVKTEQESFVMDHDPDRLTEVLSNLLSNAIKFTPAGGEVLLSIRPESDQLHILVKDTGLGISEEDLPHIFERFYQADDSITRSGAGTGIGLALSHELIELMGGSISVNSELGQGAEFQLSLPVQNEAETLADQVFDWDTTEAATFLPIASKQEDLPRLLLIEDNPDVLNYLSACLEADYQIEVAPNGIIGIEKALEMVPDLIISDVMMPGKDGFEVCASLKADLRTSHIPIMLLTAKADQDSKLTGFRQGADAYLPKPFLEEELLLRMQNMLSLRDAFRNRYKDGKLPDEAEARENQEDAFMRRLRAIILERLDDNNLSVTALCEAIGMARTPLHNKLKALIGMSTTEYVRYVRLTEAKRMLNMPELNVSEVSYQCGFQSPGYFTKRFKELYGVSPSQFREH
ncbi:MAG: ATP-binding protein [Bacteroidota bacterium]